jgi:hypothetical protein
MNPRLLLSTFTCAAALAVVPATHARDTDYARNAVLGGVLGAIIADASDHHPGEGALIGAAAGLILTAAADNNHCDRRVVAYDPPCDRRTTVVVNRCAPPTRVVYAPPPCDRRVVVVRPSCPPPRVVVIDRRHDRRDCDDRYVADRRHDNRRDDRRDRNRYDNRDRRDRRDYDSYAYDDRRR